MIGSTKILVVVLVGFALGIPAIVPVVMYFRGKESSSTIAASEIRFCFLVKWLLRHLLLCQSSDGTTTMATYSKWNVEKTRSSLSRRSCRHPNWGERSSDECHSLTHEDHLKVNDGFFLFCLFKLVQQLQKPADLTPLYLHRRMRPLQSSQAQSPPSDRQLAKWVAARLVSPVWHIDRLWPLLHLGTSGLPRTIYSSALRRTSASYCRVDPCSSSFYYYEALKITVSTNDSYSIQSNSSMDTFGYLYKNAFDPTYPSLNMLQFNDDGAGSSQFLLSMWLQTMQDYIVVATTFRVSDTGAFTIIVQGPAVVSMSLINATGQ